ncbi:MAG: hypothetical protein [Circular genetic element sp.]|nr:MAG: hypothetical protein [Circular genetic element sp.]
MTEGNLSYGSVGSGLNFYNIARDLAAINAKNEEVTDRDGHLMGYICDVSVAATGPATVSFLSAPNTWKVRNAVRKAHFLREQMFRDAGVTASEQGRYGQTLRPHLTTSMVSDGVYKNPFTFTGAGSPYEYIGGEWTYTTLASSPSWDNTPLEDHDQLPLADTYTIALCGDNVEQDDEGGIKSWQTIGLVTSYNIDRMEVVPDATADTSIVGLNNPFAMLKSQSVVSGEVGDIAKDQELEEPPYDITDNGDSVQLVKQATVIQNATESVRKARVFLPAGLMALYTTAAMAQSVVSVQVIGKVLCKDMA